MAQQGVNTEEASVYSYGLQESKVSTQRRLAYVVMAQQGVDTEEAGVCSYGLQDNKVSTQRGLAYVVMACRTTRC